jgi:phosphoribosylformimino-5-aminoimidazole carboxamide ribotide isomerase
MSGNVVHARGGKRDQYRPISTPHGLPDDPLAIARALLAITGSSVLYVADLDAIAGTGNHFETCRELAQALPHATLWIDAGFDSVSDCLFWLPIGATLVVGSEGLASAEAWSELGSFLGQNSVLSLDFNADGFLGPEALLLAPSLWPERVIVMSLGRVGSNAGPDVQRLETVRAVAGERALFSAGGLRDAGDLDAVAAAGASGALVATALHELAIRQNEIAAFLRRRRSANES